MQSPNQKLLPIEKLYGHHIEPIELKEANNNLVGLFALLIEIDKQHKQKERKDNET
jgi:hypothetical protein